MVEQKVDAAFPPPVLRSRLFRKPPGMFCVDNIFRQTVIEVDCEFCFSGRGFHQHLIALLQAGLFSGAGVDIDSRAGVAPAQRRDLPAFRMKERQHLAAGHQDERVCLENPG